MFSLTKINNDKFAVILKETTPKSTSNLLNSILDVIVTETVSLPNEKKSEYFITQFWENQIQRINNLNIYYSWLSFKYVS